MNLVQRTIATQACSVCTVYLNYHCFEFGSMLTHRKPFIVNQFNISGLVTNEAGEISEQNVYDLIRDAATTSGELTLALHGFEFDKSKLKALLNEFPGLGRRKNWKRLFKIGKGEADFLICINNIGLIYVEVLK